MLLFFLVRLILVTGLFLGAWLAILLTLAHAALPYPLTYVQSPQSPTQFKRLPDVFFPLHLEPGTHIMLLPANSTTPEVLVSGGTQGAAFDQVVSFDATKVAYSFCPDVVTRNAQKQHLPRGDCNLYEIDIATRVTTQLTFSEWVPSAQGSATPQALGYGVFNMGPAYLPGNKIIFTSSRQGYLPNKNFTDFMSQLWVLDRATGVQEQVGYMDLGSVLHPVVLASGRVLHSRYEAQGTRDKRLWGLWDMLPDGRGWGPSFSAFQRESATHFHTQRSDGAVCGINYYNKHNAGFGTLNCWNNATAVPPFGPAEVSQNVAIQQGYVGSGSAPRLWRYSFSPMGLTAMTPFATEMDLASSKINNVRVGKVSHPRGAPGNALLLTYCTGPCNHNPAPTTYGESYYQTGISVLPGGLVAQAPSVLQVVIDTPQYNEWFPVPLVPYQSVYGIPEPAAHPWLPNSTHVSLPKGTPFGLVGTSSMYNRSSAPGSPRLGAVEPFNQGDGWNMAKQGGDVGLYSNADIHAVRIVVMEPTNDVGTGAFPYHSLPGQERMYVLGDISVRKAPGVLDPDGNPDTSFLAKIPADTPFTFQTVDTEGRVLNTAQTWHMVRPGETRTDCGGCHAHDKLPTNFAQTVAGQPGYVPTDLTSNLLQKHEYYASIKPLLQRPGSCTTCHSATALAGNLDLSQTTLDANGLENAFNRLANDPNAQWGTAPPSGTKWVSPNLSRYVRAMQSRRSLLGWRLYNARLDGQTNASSSVDIDFAPAVGCQAHTVLSPAEKQAFMAWIDTGAPAGGAYHQDRLKPTIHFARGDGELRIGLYDVHSGINAATIQLLRDGLDVSPLLQATGTPHVWKAAYSPGRWRIQVADQAGNVQVREKVLP